MGIPGSITTWILNPNLLFILILFILAFLCGHDRPSVGNAFVKMHELLLFVQEIFRIKASTNDCIKLVGPSVLLSTVDLCFSAWRRIVAVRGLVYSFFRLRHFRCNLLYNKMSLFVQKYMSDKHYWVAKMIMDVLLMRWYRSVLISRIYLSQTIYSTRLWFRAM